mgnify:CR=1 FL=1
MSKQYSWADYSVAYGGRILEGVTGLDYTYKQEKSILRGRGTKGHEILKGNKDYEGKIMLWQSEVERMIADAPDNDILSLRFNITEAFVPTEGGQTVINILQDVEITELPKSFKQGDANQIIELSFIFLDLLPQQ